AAASGDWVSSTNCRPLLMLTLTGPPHSLHGYGCASASRRCLREVPQDRLREGPVEHPQVPARVSKPTRPAPQTDGATALRRPSHWRARAMTASLPSFSPTLTRTPSPSNARTIAPLSAD